MDICLQGMTVQSCLDLKVSTHILQCNIAQHNIACHIDSIHLNKNSLQSLCVA